jgi:hypothetical membrane protein
VAKGLLAKLELLSGIVGVAVLWTCIAIGMHKAHLGFLDKRPISFLGTNPGTQLLFSGSLLVSAIFFISFGYFVKRRYKIKNRFITYLVVGQLGQITAAIFPYGQHMLAGHIHTTAAFVLAFSLPLLIGEFAKSQLTSRSHRLYIKLLHFEQVMFVIGISLFVFTRGLAPLGEVLPTLGFHLWIIVLTYVIFRSARTRAHA